MGFFLSEMPEYVMHLHAYHTEKKRKKKKKKKKGILVIKLIIQKILLHKTKLHTSSLLQHSSCPSTAMTCELPGPGRPEQSFSLR